jgi:hypothetical protein
MTEVTDNEITVPEANTDERRLSDVLYDMLVDVTKADGKYEKQREAIKEGKATISGTLLALAKDARDVDTFLAECAVAEQRYKDKKKVDKLAKCWTQPKSNIKACHKLHLAFPECAIDGHETESTLRKSLNEARGKMKKLAVTDAVRKATTSVQVKTIVQEAEEAHALVGALLDDIKADLHQAIMEVEAGGTGDDIALLKECLLGVTADIKSILGNEETTDTPMAAAA